MERWTAGDPLAHSMVDLFALGFPQRVRGLGFRVEGLGFRVEGLGFRVLGYRALSGLLCGNLVLGVVEGWFQGVGLS